MTVPGILLPLVIADRMATKGLSYAFPYRSAKIEPLHALPFIACDGGGWIAKGLVSKDRF